MKRAPKTLAEITLENMIWLKVGMQANNQDTTKIDAKIAAQEGVVLAERDNALRFDTGLLRGPA